MGQGKCEEDDGAHIERVPMFMSGSDTIFRTASHEHSYVLRVLERKSLRHEAGRAARAVLVPGAGMEVMRMRMGCAARS